MIPAGRWIVTAILAALVAAGGVALRVRGIGPAVARRHLRDVAVPIGMGALAGLAALVPVLAQRAPTTLAYGNFDGWYFAGRGDWLTRHAWGARLTAQTDDPLSAVAVWSDRFHLPQGVDTTVAYTQSMLGLHGYQVLGVLGASTIAVAVCGWLTLRDALAPSAPSGWRWPLVAGLGVVSPVFVVMYGENFFAQLWGAALWPFLMATVVGVCARPSWRTVLVAAVATGATISHYPANLPWILLGAGAAVALGVRRRVATEGAGVRPALAGAAIALPAAIVCTCLVAPLQVARLVEFTRFAQGIGAAAQVAAPLPARPVLAVLAGTQTNLARLTEDWRVVLALLLLAGVAAAVATPVRGARLAAPLLPAVAVALITAVVFLRAQGRGEIYMMNKSLMTGGALLAGLAFTALASARRTRIPRTLMALGLALFIIWGGMSAFLIRRTTDGWAGFRSADRALGAQMAALGPRDPLLVEGAAEVVPTSFQYRMVTSYFAATRTDGPVEGLGSTDSYLTAPTLIPKGDAQWRPGRAWRYVVTMGDGSAVAGRRRIWSDGGYAMWRAPDLDLTPFGTGWRAALPNGATPVVPSQGPVEILVSNASDRSRTATVRIPVRSRLAARTVTVTGGTSAVATLVPVNATRTLRVEVTVPPGGVRALALTETPPRQDTGLRVLALAVTG